jgi:flagellar M-ring protein FliF
MVHQLAKELGRYLLIILAVALLYLLVLRPLIRRYTEAPAAPAPMPSAFSARVGDDESDDEAAPDGDDEATDAEDATYGRDNRRRRKASAYEQNLNDLRELAQEDPRMVAMIVRSWMNAND